MNWTIYLVQPAWSMWTPGTYWVTLFFSQIQANPFPPPPQPLPHSTIRLPMSPGCLNLNSPFCTAQSADKCCLLVLHLKPLPATRPSLFPPPSHPCLPTAARTHSCRWPTNIGSTAEFFTLQHLPPPPPTPHKSFHGSRVSASIISQALSFPASAPSPWPTHHLLSLPQSTLGTAWVTCLRTSPEHALGPTLLTVLPALTHSPERTDPTLGRKTPTP